jgi:hypothetical protein
VYSVTGNNNNNNDNKLNTTRALYITYLFILLINNGRIILRWIFSKRDGVVGTGWSWLRIGTGGGHL